MKWRRRGFDRKQHKLWFLYVLFAQPNFSVMVSWRVSVLWALLNKDIVLLTNIPEEAVLAFFSCFVAFNPILLNASWAYGYYEPSYGRYHKCWISSDCRGNSECSVLADFSPLLYSPLVCLASFSNLIFVFSY